jgi:hypothetical protein
MRMYGGLRTPAFSVFVIVGPKRRFFRVEFGSHQGEAFWDCRVRGATEKWDGEALAAQ